MDPLTSTVVTSYRLPIITTNHRPHRFRSATTCHGQTDRRTDELVQQNNIDIVNYCRAEFNFELPGTVIEQLTY